MSDVRTYTEIQEQFESPSPNGHQPVVPVRPRSLLSQVNMALLRPVQFFRNLRVAHDTRQWVIIGLIILVLVGFSAVRHDNVSNGGTESQTPDMGMEGAVPGDPFAAADPGMTGIDLGAGASEAGASSADNSASWETALITASNYVAAWLILSVLLCTISLVRGIAPRFDHNLQIAIWATLPLGLMAAFQIVYFWLGGKPGEPGISGLLPEWSKYPGLSNAEKDLMQSLTMRLTIFGVWALALAYTGARQMLHGRRWSASLVVAAWAALIVVLPVVLGTVKAPEIEATLEEVVIPGMDGMMPGEGIYPEEGLKDPGAIPSGEESEGEDSQSGGVDIQPAPRMKG